MSIPLQAGPDSPVVGTIEPLEDGARSHVSIALDLQGHGNRQASAPARGPKERATRDAAEYAEAKGATRRRQLGHVLNELLSRPRRRA